MNKLEVQSLVFAASRKDGGQDSIVITHVEGQAPSISVSGDRSWIAARLSLLLDVITGDAA